MAIAEINQKIKTFIESQNQRLERYKKKLCEEDFKENLDAASFLTKCLTLTDYEKFSYMLDHFLDSENGLPDLEKLRDLLDVYTDKKGVLIPTKEEVKEHLEYWYEQETDNSNQKLIKGVPAVLIERDKRYNILQLIRNICK